MGELILLQIEATYYPILAAIGVPVNIVAIVILCRGKCGLSKCVTRYMMAMAAADLLVVCTDVILMRTVDIYFPSSFFTITPLCCLTVTLIYVVTSASVWLTVMFTFDRFVAICFEKLKNIYCKEKTAATAITVVTVLSCLINTPWYFAYEPENMVENVNHGCVLKQTFIISAEWAAFDLFTLTLTPCVPFILIVLLNVLMVRRILVANKIRRDLRVCGNAERNKDSEIESRRKSMTFLFSISGSFILLWTPVVVYFIFLRTTIISYSGLNQLYSVAYMLELLSCCTNTFLYVLTQAKFRKELKNGMRYIMELCFKLFKS